MRLLWIFLPITLFGQILVSIPPQKFIVDQISSSSVPVHVLLPRSASPITYTLKPSDLAKIKRSRLYLRIGVPFELANLKRIRSANPELRLSDMSRYVAKFPMDDHNHGHDHLDPHTWLAPPLVALLARATLQDLIALYPERKKEFLTNYRAFVQKIADIDTAIYTKSLAKKFVVYHPSFGYFAKVYDLEQIVIEREGKEPSAKDLQELLQKAKESKILIIEPQFPKRSAQLIAKRLGLTIHTIDPLDQDLFATFQKLVDALESHRD